MRSRFVRFQITGVRSIGGLQYVSGRSLAGEELEDVLRIEAHGTATVPPLGSIGYAVAMGEGRTRMLMIGGEDKEIRPGLGDVPGHRAIYDAFGNIIRLTGPQVDMDFAANSVTFKAGDWTIDSPTLFRQPVTIDSGGEPGAHLTIKAEKARFEVDRLEVTGEIVASTFTMGAP